MIENQIYNLIISERSEVQATQVCTECRPNRSPRVIILLVLCHVSKGKKKQLTLVEGYRHLYSRGETQQRLIDGLPPPVVTVATPVELPVAV